MKTLKLAVLGGGSSYATELLDGIISRWKTASHAREIAMVDVRKARNGWKRYAFAKG